MVRCCVLPLLSTRPRFLISASSCFAVSGLLRSLKISFAASLNVIKLDDILKRFYFYTLSLNRLFFYAATARTKTPDAGVFVSLKILFRFRGYIRGNFQYFQNPTKLRKRLVERKTNM